MTDRENIQAIEEALVRIKAITEDLFTGTGQPSRPAEEIETEVAIIEKNLNELKQRL